MGQGFNGLNSMTLNMSNSGMAAPSQLINAQHLMHQQQSI
jgi:hypothetical protein